MALATRFAELVRACFTGIWIESHEHPDAITEIAQLCRDEQWQFATWDIDSSLGIAGQSESSSGNADPLAAIRAVNALATAEGTATHLANLLRRLAVIDLVDHTAIRPMNPDGIG